MLEMTQVTKAYRTDLLETHALREFSLKVEKGEFVAVTGPSGSGKTTFLNVAGLLETFDSGSYRLDGEDVSRLDDDARSRVRNHKIGFIFQSFNLIPDLNVFDNVDVPLRYRRMPAAERRERIDSALDLVGLSSRMKHLPSQLSGGQQQRVAIARALAGDPALLLADEPTGNLDSLMARQVMDLLEQINGMGATIVMVTHDPELARRAHRNVQVIDGQITDYKPYEAHSATVTVLHPPAADAAVRLSGHRRLHHVRLRPAPRARQPEAPPGLSALMVLAIALGIAVCTVTFTIYHAMATNPIPDKSEPALRGDARHLERRPPVRRRQARESAAAADLPRCHVPARRQGRAAQRGHVQVGRAAACRSARASSRSTRRCASPRTSSSRCSTCRSSTARAGTRRPTRARSPWSC